MNKDKLNRILFGKPETFWIKLANVTINLCWVFLLGLLIDKSIHDTILIMATWSVCLLMGKAKHYSSPLKCFLMQVLIFTSLFLSTYIDVYVAIAFTIYTKFILSGWADIYDIEPDYDDKPDIQDFTLWKPQGEASVHQPLIDYLKYNALTEEYLEAERILKEKVSTETFMVYKRKFIDGYSYEQIANEFDLPNPRIKEHLDKCYFFLVGRLNI